MSTEEIYVGLWDHIDDLRSTLLKIFFIIALGFITALLFHESIIQFFIPSTTYPEVQKEKIEYERVRNLGQREIYYTLPSHVSPFSVINSSLVENSTYKIYPGGYVEYEKKVVEPQLVLLSPLEGLTVTLKICFWVALAGTAPFWMTVLMGFIAPGLKEQEKRLIFPFLLLSFLFMAIGILFAHHVTVPFANHYFSLFNREIGLNFWSLSHYVDYSFILLMGHAVAFELSLLLLFLVHYGCISADWLVAKRRMMIVAAFILGAILTPPDVLTQFLMAIPMIAIYEIAILYAKRKNSNFTKM